MSSLKVVIGGVLVVLLVAYLFPTAISAVAAASTGTWSAEAHAIWDILPLLCVVAALVMIVGPALREF